MRYHALACDYDGTIAHHGKVDADTVAALERVRDTGRRLLLVTGRHLEDLQRAFPRLDLFHRVVVENGAVIYDPTTREIRTLVDPPLPLFVDTLRARGVAPLAVGRAIVATWEPHERTVLDVIHELGLELQVVFNKGAVMVLPSGVNKAYGLCAALEPLGLSPHNVVGVGDAENDHAFLAACECAVAVDNALPMLKRAADMVTSDDHGAGVRELIDELIDSDLRRLGEHLARHALVLGTTADDERVCIQPYTRPVLLAGTSGAGKSTLATALLEQLDDRKYQFCIIDPEGDYRGLPHVAVLGDSHRVPALSEILEMLDESHHSVVANLLGVPMSDRPAYFQKLLAGLFELRGRTGRPHWIVMDEAHHLLPAARDGSALALPREPHGLLVLTVHPANVSAPVLATVGTAIVVGSEPQSTLAAIARATGERPPPVDSAPLQPGDAIVWTRLQERAHAAVRIKAHLPRSEHQRHIRKYAVGELGVDRSFFFRGPRGILNLRAQNLQLFLQIADGVDDDTWTFHLRNRDYSQWFLRDIKDPDLAHAAAAVEGMPELSPRESRARIRDAVQARYTAPA